MLREREARDRDRHNTNPFEITLKRRKNVKKKVKCVFVGLIRNKTHIFIMT